MKRTIKETITINKGITISDPWYDSKVKCRYSNRRKMENYILFIRTSPMEECEDYYDLQMCLLKDETYNQIEFSDDLYSFTIPNSYKIKKFDIGIDTATVLIGSNDNDFIEEIHTGGDGYLGNVFQISKPIITDGKTKNEYCGIVFSASFDAELNSPKDIINIIKYNLTGLPIV
jgi:hypothetical protein